jgi:hypothetical protein
MVRELSYFSSDEISGIKLGHDPFGWTLALQPHLCLTLPKPEEAHVAE